MTTVLTALMPLLIILVVCTTADSSAKGPVYDPTYAGAPYGISVEGGSLLGPAKE